MCDRCGKCFLHRKSFSRHLTSMCVSRATWDKRTCKQCKLKFQTISRYQRHMLIVHDEESSTVLVDESSAAGSKSKAKSCKTDVKGQTCLCAVCGKTLASKRSLLMHLTAIHTQNQQKKEKSTVCDKLFFHKSDLSLHMTDHGGDVEKQFKCFICEKTFKLQQSLKLHLNAHKGIKPHPCNLCEKSFQWKRSLNSHLQRHLIKKPYACDLCFKSYKNKVDLNHHHSCIHRTDPISNVYANRIQPQNKSNSTAGAVQVEANLQKELSVHLHFT